MSDEGAKDRKKGAEQWVDIRSNR